MSKYNGRTEARAKANAEYDKRTYKMFSFKLRIEEDADIIRSIADAAENGINKREWIRELFDSQKENARE